MARSDHLFQRLCLEAAATCGSDIAAVERYVNERIAAFDAEARSSLRRDVERVLRFRAPDVRTLPPH